MESSGSNFFIPGQSFDDFDFEDIIINNLEENCKVIKQFQNNGKKTLQLSKDGFLICVKKSSYSAQSLPKIIDTVNGIFALKAADFFINVKKYQKLYMSTPPFDSGSEEISKKWDEEQIKQLYYTNIALLNGLKNIIKAFDQTHSDKDHIKLLLNIMQKYEGICSEEKNEIQKLEIEILTKKIDQNTPLGLAIDLGIETLKNPEAVIDKYLCFKEGIKFNPLSQPSDSLQVKKFLSKVNSSFDAKECSLDNLIALEVFAMNALHSYITNPKAIIDPNFLGIIEILNEIKEKSGSKLRPASNEEVTLKREQNKKFFNFLKQKLEENPNYPKSFWLEPEISKKMKIADPILHLIRKKVSNPLDHLNKPAVLFHENNALGYQIYHYPAVQNEKPKLLLFITTAEISYKYLPTINSNLGLFGDRNILQNAENILSNILSTNVLEGYLPNLKNGDIEIIASGFDNRGAAATIVSNKLAMLFPNTEVISLAIGSTEVVSTEDAYNMNKAKNYLPIRLKSLEDKFVERKQIMGFSSFSNKSYNTFPVLVKYNANSADYYKHNNTEYGSVDNFIPAMKNPLILQSIYQNCLISSSIDTTQLNQDQINQNHILQSFIQISDKTSKKLFEEINGIKNTEIKFTSEFLVFDKKNNNFISRNEKLNQQEEEDTIFALQQSLNLLKNTKLDYGQLQSLLITCNAFLIYNYQSDLTDSGGNRAELIDSIYKIKILVHSELEILNKNGDLNFNASEYKTLKTLSKIGKKLINIKQIEKDVLNNIDFEDQFLEFLGFKIATKNIEKVGSENYTTTLHQDLINNFDINLYSPMDPYKKQKIVISCSGVDALGSHGVSSGNFGTGDLTILNRAEGLGKNVCKILNEKFEKYHFNAEEIEIVVLGFGSEGAVATALGFQLSNEYEECQVSSIGFGAPRFTAEDGAKSIKDKENFSPIRLLSSQDVKFEKKLFAMMDYNLSDGTYYTIPIQFRAPTTLELSTLGGGGHLKNLYGDVHAIKRAMKTAYQMHEIATTGADINIPQTEKSAKLAKRVQIDSRFDNLVIYSKKTSEDLRKIEPGKLIQAINYCAELSENKYLTYQDKEIIKKFFDSFIKAIRSEKTDKTGKFFNEMLKHGYRADVLLGGKFNLQRIISENLDKAFLDLENGVFSDAKDINEQILRTNFYRGILAGDLNGNQYKPAGGGVNGAIFFTKLEWDLDLKRTVAFTSWENHDTRFLGVFKPHPYSVWEEKGYSMLQMAELGKEFFGMASYLNPNDEDKRVHNEIYAYELFHAFGFNQYIGYPTTLEFANKNDSKGRPASFCEFLPGLDVVKDHVKKSGKSEAKSNNLDEKYKKYSDEELFLWQMSKIFDFLTGNMDGHEGNAFVAFNDKHQLTKAVNFDYDKAFPAREPINVFNQYKWGSLEISKEHNFTTKTIEALQRMKNEMEPNLQKFKEKTYGTNRKNFTDSQEKLFFEKIKILDEILSGNIKNLYDLAQTKK